MKITADDYKETNESPALLKDALENPPQEEEQNFHNSKFAKWMRNFWYYHWWKVLLGGAIIFLSFYYIPDLIEANRNKILYINAVNCMPDIPTDSLVEQLTALELTNKDKGVVRFDNHTAFAIEKKAETDYNTIFSLQMSISDGDYDALLMDRATADHLCEFILFSESVYDFLPKEIADQFPLYAVTPSDYHEITPGFLVTDNEILKESGLFNSSKEYVLIPTANAPNPENQIIFLQFLAQ